MSKGRRGPAPLPTAIKKQRGTLRANRTNTKEPQPRVGAPKIPASVASSPDAKECWTTLVPKLVKLRVLSDIDAIALEGMCQAYARAKMADKAIKKGGLLVKTSWGTLVQNPAVSISRSSWSEVRRFAEQFGLTPSSRSRVQELPEETDVEANAEQTASGFLFGNVVGSIGK
jgi:P27 family predicted phage terminase small subunit